MQDNLLEKYWGHVLPVLKAKYDRVPPELWEAVRGRYDGVVRLVREVYAPGRADIIIEGEVRSLLNHTCWEAAEEDEARGVV